MQALNIERVRKLNEFHQFYQKTGDVTSSVDMESLTTSIHVQTEQNKVLKRIFSELEKDLRSLTDTRIALEIKLDYLNTTSTTTTTAASNAATGSITSTLTPIVQSKTPQTPNNIATTAAVPSTLTANKNSNSSIAGSSSSSSSSKPATKKKPTTISSTPVTIGINDSRLNNGQQQQQTVTHLINRVNSNLESKHLEEVSQVLPPPPPPPTQHHINKSVFNSTNSQGSAIATSAIK
jgi:hypothetical protein